MKKLIQSFLARLNIALHRKSGLDSTIEGILREAERRRIRDIKFAVEFAKTLGDDIVDLMQESRSQLGQDVFALSELKKKENGFFVEFGATDGVTISNTYLLEKRFGYNGILAEPNPRQRAGIYHNRKVHIEEKCVWRESGQTLDFIDAGDLSTLGAFTSSDHHGGSRRGNPTFDVETISLIDMLKKYDAPRVIDYLSIDTAGSEFEILASHDFCEYSFRVITVEHNYSEMRLKIFELLTSKGYQRRYTEFSEHDDWYVLASRRAI